MHVPERKLARTSDPVEAVLGVFPPALLGLPLDALGGCLAENGGFPAEAALLRCPVTTTDGSVVVEEVNWGDILGFLGFEVRISCMREKASSILFAWNSFSCCLGRKETLRIEMSWLSR